MYNKITMIVLTGGAGFIGSAFLWKLNTEGIKEVIVVDELGSSDKWKNLINRTFADYIDKDKFLNRLTTGTAPPGITCIIHMGACSSTTETDADYMMRNNYQFTKKLAEWSLKNDAHFIYASSAATYGDGSSGFSDDNETTLRLKPLNLYGYSKHLFDLTALRMKGKIAGLKFFNVFGPNEYHKGEMSSFALKAFHQIKNTGMVRLFKSHKGSFEDGEQVRDFIYIKDCVDVMWWFYKHREISGIFNLGTGAAQTWNSLVRAVFRIMGKPPIIKYIDMPVSLEKQYQYYTKADTRRLKDAGYSTAFMSLEEGIKDYIRNYLLSPDPFL